MSENCPRCGSPISAGEDCPKCLLKISMAGGVDPNAPSGFPGLEILELIGRGGMGEVYRAKQTDLQRIVAVKLLAREYSSDPESVERFKREASTLAALNHPNIVAVYDTGVLADRAYLVMEYVEGSTLREQMAGVTAPRRALDLALQILGALEFAHGRGIVHRDVKPENIFIDRSGRVKIGDFGLAKLFREGQPPLTRTHDVMGTPRYMAPEQYSRLKEVDHRADLFSVGVILYEMLTGELPVGKFEPPSDLALVDSRFDAIVFKALESAPDRRYQQASAMLSDLGALMGRSRQAPALLRKPQAAPDPPPAPKPGRWPVGIWIACTLVLIAAFTPWVVLEQAGARTYRGLEHLNISMDVNSWKSSINVVGLSMPNWILFFAALVIGVLALPRSLRILSGPPLPELIIACYGTLHAVVCLTPLLLGSSDGLDVLIVRHPGFGVFATLASFSALITLEVREWILGRSRAAPAVLPRVRFRIPFRRGRLVGK